MKSEIKIYTDGAAKGNPGSAGWGAIILSGKEIFEIGGGVDHATNNQMELTAPIEALKYIKKHKLTQPIEFFSDSKSPCDCDDALRMEPANRVYP